MNRISDLEINCAVRRVLVRHWIDLGRMSLRTTRGVVCLTGTISKISHAGAPLDTGRMLVILAEIKRLKNVQRINTNLTNWIFEGGTWRMSADEKASQAASAPEARESLADINVWQYKEKPKPA